MTAQDDLLHQTLSKVRTHIEPSPELLDDIRAAVARAERRRRLVALSVIAAILLATVLALFVLLNVRAAGNGSPTTRPASPTTVITTQTHVHEGTTNGEHRRV